MPKAFNFFAWVVLVPIHSASTCIKYGGSLCICSRPAALLLLHAYFKCQAQQRFTSSRLWKVSHKTSTCWGRLCWRFHKSDQWKRITICKLAVIAPRWDENYGLFLYRGKKIQLWRLLRVCSQVVTKPYRRECVSATEENWFLGFFRCNLAGAASCSMHSLITWHEKHQATNSL